MITPRTWKAFPATYRAREMQILARWILVSESGSAVGLAGCGRSNLLGFLCDRPEVLMSYLTPLTTEPETRSVALIPVDLNNLPADDPATLYRVILRAFYWVCDRFARIIQERITSLYLENRATRDPFLAQSALHEVLFAFQAEETQVVLVLNRFDRFCQLSLRMINTLRGLRDSFKETLCLIAGMLQEAAYLPNPEALGDLYELLDSHVCWVGAMSESDARWVIAQATHTAAQPPTEQESAAMLSLAGNFPALLKAIGQWWLDHRGLSVREWRDALQAEPSLEHRLTKMWNGLTQEEQFALAAVLEWQERVKEPGPALKQAFETLAQEYGHILSRLVVKGVCERTDMGWQIKGQLLTDYVKRVGPLGRGRIRLDEETEEIYQGLTRLEDELMPQERILLRFMVENPQKPHTYDDLIDQVWSGDETAKYGITSGDVQRLVSGLRKKIEMVPSEPQYIINWRGKPGGYRFYSEGRPS